MAAGKGLGEFSLKATSLTLTPGPGGSLLVQGNFEGSSTNFGTIPRTATFASVGAKSGTFSVCAAAYPENGDTLTGTGQGYRASQMARPGIVSRLRWSALGG